MSCWRCELYPRFFAGCRHQAHGGRDSDSWGFHINVVAVLVAAGRVVSTAVSRSCFHEWGTGGCRTNAARCSKYPFFGVFRPDTDAVPVIKSHHYAWHAAPRSKAQQIKTDGYGEGYAPGGFAQQDRLLTNVDKLLPEPPTTSVTTESPEITFRSHLPAGAVAHPFRLRWHAPERAILNSLELIEFQP